MRISDWSSDVCSSDLIARAPKRVMINAGFAVTARFDFWGSTMRKTFTSLAFAALASLGLALTPLPAAAQMREIDPSNMQIDSDLDNPAPPPVTSTTTDQSYDSDLATGDQQTSEMPVDGGAAATNAPADMTATDVSADDSSTYKQADLIGAADG